MKKTYLQPSTLLTQVGLHKMICVSGNPQVTVSTSVDDAVDAGSVDSRRGNDLWGDDDE